MASRRIAGITIEIDGNTTKLNDALKSVDKQLASTQSQLKDVEKLLKMDPRNTELLAQKQRLLTDAIEGSKDRLKELEKAQAELAKKDASPELQKQQDALQREIVETQQKIKGFEDELGKIPNKAQIAFDKIGEGLKKTGEKMTEVGENMTKYVTGPIAAAGAASVAAFTEVDDAMDTVILKTGATGDAAKDMQKIVENVATSIPTDFQTAADAVGQINTKFGATGDQLEDLTDLFVKFASVNNKDVSSSVDSVQKSMAAYGVQLQDAEHYMNVLTKTSQETGADVDKLAGGIVQNAAAFQEMGLSVDQAVQLMGQMERSGANSETVMNGLRKALQKATKQGVPLSKVLGDLQEEIRSNKNQTQALTDTYDLFGKSGDQVFNAIKNGTMDFSNFGDEMAIVGNTVRDTFDATVDGADNWKMAMNEVKLLGSDIGGMLSEFAGPVLKKVRDALQEAVGWWRNLNEHQQETILKVAGIIAAIGPAVTVIGKLTSAVGLLSQGLGILAANPVAAATIGLTTAFGGLALAVKNAGDEGDAYMEETYGLNTAMQENIDKINELRDAYEESNKKKDEAFGKYDAEYDYLQELAEEYDGYLDKNGKVIEKYKERADFIETTLAEALGIEREDIRKIIEENGNLSDSIDKVIEKRKAEALLNALQDDYTQAIVNSEEAERRLMQAEDDLAGASKRVKDIQDERNKIEKLQQEYIEKNGYASSEYADQLNDLRVDLEYAEKAEQDLTTARDEAASVYEDYQATIKNYEGVSSAVIEGDTTRIHNALEAYKQDFRTAETSTESTLKKQVQDYKAEYEQAKNAVANGSKLITKADLAEKQYWYKQAQLEYNKATKAAKDAASDAAGGYAAQLRAGRPKVERASDYVAGGAIDPLKKIPGKAEDYGYQIDNGLANGINGNKWKINAAVNNVSNAIDQLFRKDLLINSPSKLTEYFGQMLDEGLAIGMGSGAAVQAAQNLARDVAQPFETQSNRDTVANAAPMNQATMVEAFQTALSRMKVEMDDREMGSFVEKTVVKAVYA